MSLITQSFGTAGQRLILEKKYVITCEDQIEEHVLKIHCNKLVTTPMDVAAGTSGYAWLDGEPEGTPKKAVFLDLVADREGLSWWFIDAVTPASNSTRVGVAWTLGRLHFQPFVLGESPWTAGRRPAIAFTNTRDYDIFVKATFGRAA